MKYIYTPVPFTEIAKGLEDGRLKAKDVYFETASFKGVRVLSDTKLDLEDCVKTTFYLKKRDGLGEIEMKTYTIKFYGNTTCVHILSGLRLDFRGYSKDDLLESLWGFGYLNEDELAYLDEFTNAWTIEEEAE